MMKAFAIALVLALGCTAALAEDDDDKVPEADMAKVTAALADLGCKDPEGVKKEEEGIYESARWARWTSSSTRTSRSFLFRAIRHATPRAQRGLRTTAT
jgi:hypothetical protein